MTFSKQRKHPTVHNNKLRQLDNKDANDNLNVFKNMPRPSDTATKD